MFPIAPIQKIDPEFLYIKNDVSIFNTIETYIFSWLATLTTKKSSFNIQILVYKGKLELLSLFKYFCLMEKTTLKYKDRLQVIPICKNNDLRAFSVIFLYNGDYENKDLKRIKYTFFILEEEKSCGFIVNQEIEAAFITTTLKQYKPHFLKEYDYLEIIHSYKTFYQSNYIPTIVQLFTFLEDVNLSYFSWRTIPSTALKLWKKLDKGKGQPLLNREIEDFVRYTYRGGLLIFNKNIANKIEENIYHYDVKSLYPAIMRKFYQFPFNLDESNKIYFNNWDDFENLTKGKKQIGFVHCRITLDKYLEIPFLKTRNYPMEIEQFPYPFELLSENPLETYYPKIGQTWEDRYTVPEILYAYTLGCYTITPIYGYLCAGKAFLFRNFVSKVYEKKEYYNKPQYFNRFLSNYFKLVLNTLSGRLGVKCHLEIEILKYNTLSFTTISKTRLTYVHYASYITSYGRMFIHKALMACGENNVLYSHTDSIFSRQPLPKYFICGKRRSFKDKLGKFVLKNPSLPNEYKFYTVNNYIAKSQVNDKVQYYSPHLGLSQELLKSYFTDNNYSIKQLLSTNIFSLTEHTLNKNKEVNENPDAVNLKLLISELRKLTEKKQ